MQACYLETAKSVRQLACPDVTAASLGDNRCREREAITKLANDTEAAVDFHIARATLSEFAAFVGRWLSKNAEEGY